MYTELNKRRDGMRAWTADADPTPEESPSFNSYGIHIPCGLACLQQLKVLESLIKSRCNGKEIFCFRI